MGCCSCCDLVCRLHLLCTTKVSALLLTNESRAGVRDVHFSLRCLLPLKIQLDGFYRTRRGGLVPVGLECRISPSVARMHQRLSSFNTRNSAQKTYVLFLG